MIRRLFVTCCSLVLVATTATGCSTFTKNQNAATANSHTLSVKDYEKALAELRDVVATTNYDGDDATGEFSRNMLGNWVIANLALDQLTDTGNAPTADAVKASEISAASRVGQNWDKFSQTTRDFLLPAFVVGDYLQANPSVKAPDFSTGHVQVDSRYGSWDGTAGQLVPTR